MGIPEHGIPGLTPREFDTLVSQTLDLIATGQMISVENDKLLRVHPPSACEGRNCWVHNPSDTHMKKWPIWWRDDKGTAERMCPHRIGHPDPDDVAYHWSLGRDVSVHGCDGCCGSLISDDTDTEK